MPTVWLTISFLLGLLIHDSYSIQNVENSHAPVFSINFSRVRRPEMSFLT